MSGDPARWAAALDGAIPAVPLADCRRLVLVAAHPDDETLGAGALLAAAAERGIPTTVVLATLGEASHPASPTHGRAALAAIRRSELAAALQLLAPAAQLVSLGLPDGAIAGHREDLVERLQAVVGAGGTGCWLVANYRGDGHPDHRAVGDAAAEVAGRIGDIVLLEYPLWAWVWTDPADAAVPLDRTLRIATEPAGRLPIHHAAKQRAVAGYRSQLEPLSPAVGDEAVVPLSLLDHLARFGEVFVGDRPPTTPEHAERGDRRSIPGDFFDDQYDASDDPWSFVTSWYERRKRELTLACLPRPQFASVFEPGCSIGTLTAALAPRCRHLLAADVSARALERAAERLRGVDTVEFCRMRVPMEWPDGEFDLVVLSEMAYYLGDSDLDRLIERTLGSLAADGVVVACHWRHPVAEYPLGGDEVHRRLRAVPELALLAEHVEEDFRLDVLVRPPAVSVARREGKA